MKFRNQKGQILIFGLVFMGIISLAMVSFVTYEGRYAGQVKSNYQKEKALQLAEAGLNKAIRQINDSSSIYTGETLNFGGGVVEVTVTDLDSKNKILTATAYLPNKTAPIAKRVIRTKISTDPLSTSISFHYGMQAGDGGITMEENSTIQGNVYSNGNFDGKDKTKSFVTGDLWVAGSSAGTPNQASEFYNSDFIFGKEKTDQLDAAQSFKPSKDANLNRVGFLIKKIGNPSNTHVYVVSDNAGRPSKTKLAEGEIKASLVTTSYNWITISLGHPPALTADTTYWLIINGNEDKNNYWSWAKDSTDSYGRGTAFYSKKWDDDHATWTALNADLAFKIWLGGDPSIISDANVGGDAHANTIKNTAVGRDAYYQVLTNSTVVRTSYPNSDDPPSQDFPISDGNISDWKQAAESGGTITGDYSPAGGETVYLGPKKITGNLLLDNNQTLILTGTVWVQGYIKVDNNGSIQLAPGYHDASGLVITDSWIHVGNNFISTGSGTAGSYIMFISLAVCPGDVKLPNCTDHNGSIDLHEKVNAGIFYAPFGLIHLHNNIKVKELTGYKISMSNNSTIEYDSGLASAYFTNGPSGAWQVIPGFWQEIK